MGKNIAIVGATGNVGREILRILDERQFPIDSIDLLASENSACEELDYGEDNTIKVGLLEQYDFKGRDIVFFAAGNEVSKTYVPKATAVGCVVIDNSSLYRMDDDVPLVVPEVNGDDISGYASKNIIANPNCSAAQLAVALKPLHDMAKIKRVIVSTYQSVSGAGNNAMDELFHQTRSIFVSEMTLPKVFPKQIAFNVIPKIGEFDAKGATGEEQKMVNEMAKILDPDIKLTVTCVRVPVFIGHSEAVNVEFANPLGVDQAIETLKTAPGVIVTDIDDEDDFITPVDCVGDYATYVSRIREDQTLDTGLNFWVVSDNLRKGAALNAVQIAEILVNKHLN